MSFLTGKHVHQVGSWMIGVPLPREEMTWARRLDRAGIPSTMLGKMDLCGDYQDGGFTEHRILRRRGAWNPYPRAEPDPSRLRGYVRADKRRHLELAGPRASKILSDGGFGGEADDRVGNYDHDRLVTDWALDYLRARGRERPRRPWACYVGLLMPHWPFCVPEEFYRMYPANRVELPFDWRVPNPDLHPAVRHFQSCLGLEGIGEDCLRRALAAYLGMVTCMDAMVGEILGELERQGMAENTLVVYTSDHGESLGEHGLFYKQCSYEGSVGVPLLLAGPGVPAGAVVDHPVSLVDLYPTILDAAGLQAEPDRPGRSWLPLARGERAGRPDWTFSEFHGNCFLHDWYMLARGRYKYTWYTDERPSLFDVVDDPRELRDLALEPGHERTLREFEELLRSIVDPEATALRARRDMGLIGPDGADYTKTMTVAEWEARTGHQA
jgi:choline-sulfatase